MNVKFGCRHVLRFGGVDKPDVDVLPTCTLLTGNQRSCAVTAWHGITSTPGAQSELHCSVFAAVSGWCWSVRREAQRCSSRSWTESGYMLTSVLTPSLQDVWCMSDVTDSPRVIDARPSNHRDVFVERSSTPIEDNTQHLHVLSQRKNHTGEWVNAVPTISLEPPGRASAFVLPNILARAGGVVDRINIFVTSTLIAMQNLVAVSYAVVRGCDVSGYWW